MGRSAGFDRGGRDRDMDLERLLRGCGGRGWMAAGALGIKWVGERGG